MRTLFFQNKLLICHTVPMEAFGIIVKEVNELTEYRNSHYFGLAPTEPFFHNRMQLKYKTDLKVIFFLSFPSQLHLFDIDTQIKTTILNYCSYVQVNTTFLEYSRNKGSFLIIWCEQCLGHKILLITWLFIAGRTYLAVTILMVMYEGWVFKLPIVFCQNSAS